jgi:hypothetical protein
MPTPLTDDELRDAANKINERMGIVERHGDQFIPDFNKRVVILTNHVRGQGKVDENTEKNVRDFHQEKLKIRPDDVVAYTTGPGGDINRIVVTYSDPEKLHVLLGRVEEKREAHQDNTLTSAQTSSVKPTPYTLKDPEGDNVVTDVVKYRDERGSGYKIEGANCL